MKDGADRTLAAALAVGIWVAICASHNANAGTPPSAGVSSEDREAQRSELYRAAMKAAAAGHWGDAKEKLHAALAIRSSPKVLFSLGQAEEQLGQLASAQADYARSLETAATEGKGEVVGAAELAERALAPRVPHLRVVLVGSELGKPVPVASSASATLDDQPIAIGAAVAVDPGEHRLVVSARGMRSVTVSARISEGEQLERSIALVPDEPAPTPATLSVGVGLSAPALPTSASPPSPAPADASPSRGSPARTAGLVIGGVGVIALGVGAVFGVESIAKHNDAESACPSTACPTARGAALWHDAVTAGNESTVAFLVGGAGLLVGALLWFTAPTSGASTQLGFGPRSVQVQAAW